MSNYAYVCARVKARRSKLLSREVISRMVSVDLPQIARMMGETVYKREMEELASKYRGVDLIEIATYRNLARDFGEILGFCRGSLRRMVEAYLSRWDIWNLKNILRAKIHGAELGELLTQLIPAGSFDEKFLSSLASLEKLEDVIEKLRETPYYNLIRPLAEDPNLLPRVEDSLDKFYYADLLSRIPGRGKPARSFRNFIRTEIDMMNLRTLIRMKVIREQVSPEMIIEGGEMEADELLRISEMDFRDFIAALRKYRFYDYIRDGLEKIEESIAPVDRMIERYMMRRASRFSYLYPLSVIPVLDYFIRKKAEVDNIRIIARGKELGMSEEEIREELK